MAFLNNAGDSSNYMAFSSSILESRKLVPLSWHHFGVPMVMRGVIITFVPLCTHSWLYVRSSVRASYLSTNLTLNKLIAISTLATYNVQANLTLGTS